MGHLTVLSMTSCEPKGLAPAPSLADMATIMEARDAHRVPAITDLMKGPIRILANYRGWNLYCEGDVTVYRDDPKSTGGHGYAGEPIIGTTEFVTIICAAGWFKCEIRY